ncbi:MAG TPA: sigma-70 family RNA polymerase sigma factor [Gemmataceae bacterium]|nr:sigma-70 family RNA polymerase sigma factor [Gemmataceae bacterium]
MQSSERVGRERALRRAVLAGDESAWRAWYDECFDALFAYVLWRCSGLRDVAEEVVQETWLTAVRRVRHFDPEAGTFAGWLRGIAANLLRNRFRRARRHDPFARANGVSCADGTAESADAEALRRERAGRIARALAELSERHEAVLRAKYLEGRAVADIAAEWHETPKAVESLLTRAREAFRAAYGNPE